jgi:hypothetical protein
VLAGEPTPTPIGPAAHCPELAEAPWALMTHSCREARRWRRGAGAQATHGSPTSARMRSWMMWSRGAAEMTHGNLRALRRRTRTREDTDIAVTSGARKPDVTNALALAHRQRSPRKLPEFLLTGLRTGSAERQRFCGNGDRHSARNGSFCSGSQCPEPHNRDWPPAPRFPLNPLK